MKNVIEIEPKDQEEWLELRKKSIGGSDAATVMGLNKYESLYSLWLDKTGQSKPKEMNEAMRQGHDLEDYVALRFCEATGKEVKVKTSLIKNDKYPFAHATIDREIAGENAGLECKTISGYAWDRLGDNEFPPYYYVQCLHYMAVCNFDKYYLAVLVLGRDFKWFEFERDDEAIEGLMDAESKFWELVENNTPPGFDGSDATEDAISRTYNDPVDESVILYDLSEDADNLEELKEEEKWLKRKIKKIEQKIKTSMGNAYYGETDRFKFSWKPQVRRSFNVKRLEKEHPDIDIEQYYDRKESRVFRVRKLK